MSRLRIHSLTVSLDGYVAGPEQSLQHPLGIGGERLHDWAFATRCVALDASPAALHVRLVRS